jgi:hypothetical protein
VGLYRIWIGTNNKGAPLVGAHMLRDGQPCKQIYPSQMAHRCTARDKTGAIRICTPTDAMADGLEIIAYYPRANGALSTRR